MSLKFETLIVFLLEYLCAMHKVGERFPGCEAKISIFECEALISLFLNS